MPVSKRALAISESKTASSARQARTLAEQGIDVIRLNIGEPNFPTPLNIKASAIDAIQEGKTKYTDMRGDARTRQAIAQKLEKENNLHYHPDSEIVITPGAKQAIYDTLLACCNPHDEVLIPTPYWTSYPDMVKIASCKPVFIETSIQTGYKLNQALLEQAITPKTKALILNSPNNPSGAVYDHSELNMIGEILIKNPHIVLICDDVYEKILIHEHTKLNHITNLIPQLKDQVIYAHSLSKSYAMTGWRLGYVAGPKDIVKAITNIQSQTTGSVNSISQAAAIDAVSKQSHEHVDEMLSKYRSRYQLCCERLSEFEDISYPEVEGGFYILLNMEKIIQKLNLKDDIELVDHLLHEAHISVVPGSAFGIPMHIRISFATSKAKLNEAFDRLKEVIRK